MNRYKVAPAVFAAVTVLAAQSQGTEQPPPPKEIFLECTATQTICASGTGCADESKKYVIAWKGDSIRHLDDYGVMEYSKGCEVTDRWVYCHEKTPPDNVIKDWRQRRTILERATGNIEHVYRSDPTEEGVDLDRKGGPLPKWLLRLRGSCVPRAKANLF